MLAKQTTTQKNPKAQRVRELRSLKLPLTFILKAEYSDDKAAPAPRKTHSNQARAPPVESLFAEEAESARKMGSVPTPIDIDTDSSIEIVAENILPKPQLKKKPEPKAQVKKEAGVNKRKSNQVDVALVKGKHSDVKDSAENDRAVAERDRHVSHTILQPHVYARSNDLILFLT